RERLPQARLRKLNKRATVTPLGRLDIIDLLPVAKVYPGETMQDCDRRLPSVVRRAVLAPVVVLLLNSLGFVASLPAGGAELDKESLSRDALSAAPPAIATTAPVVDWDDTVLRQGSGDYICRPTPPNLREKGGREPMALDKVWMAWADAWASKQP